MIHKLKSSSTGDLAAAVAKVVAHAGPSKDIPFWVRNHEHRPVELLAGPLEQFDDVSAYIVTKHNLPSGSMNELTCMVDRFAADAGRYGRSPFSVTTNEQNQPASLVVGLLDRCRSIR